MPSQSEQEEYVRYVMSFVNSLPLQSYEARLAVFQRILLASPEEAIDPEGAAKIARMKEPAPINHEPPPSVELLDSDGRVLGSFPIGTFSEEKKEEGALMPRGPGSEA